jgi:hypothetical protein
MPSKDDKIKNEAPKAKNFFDLDEDDDAEVADEQPTQQSTRITGERLKDLGASMRNIFHEDNEDDLFEDKEEEEIKVSEQQQKATSKEERREQLRTEFPQHFYDGGSELNHVVSKTEIKPVQEPVENPEPAKVEEDNSTITAAEQTATAPKRTEISNDRLKEIGAAMRDIFHEENEDDLFEEKDEEQQKKASTKEERREELKAEHPQHFYDGNTALNDVMPKSEPAKKYSIFGDGPEDEDEENELEIVSNLDFLTKNQNEATTPEITREDALNKLRAEVFTNKGINQEEEEKELTEAEEILYKMEHDRIKAAQSKEKAPNESSPTFTIEHVKNMAQMLEVEEDDEPAFAKKPAENPAGKKEDSNEVKEDNKDTAKSETKPEEKNVKDEKINDSANVAIFINKLNTFNNMYKLKIDANDFAFSVTESWTKMSAADEKQKGEGKQMLQDLFKDTLKQAFDIEKDVSYDEHRLPDYNEIIKSSNELLRVAMFAFTDLYHNSKSASLFDQTAFGGVNAKDMAELTSGESLWSMDQKSDDAWDIQSKEAKEIADKWLGERKPYETMINEMNALVEANKKGIIDRKEILNKLAAAEWLLLNDERMMVENPEDPINPIPNWGNRYWKTLTSTREALGIDKHISMRELIQGDYAASAKAANNKSYTETQIKDYVLDPEARAVYDSMDIQKEQFATQSAAVVLSEPEKEKENDKEKTPEERLMTELRIRISIKSEDQREIMKNEPKSYNFISEKTAEVQLDGIKNTPNV